MAVIIKVNQRCEVGNKQLYPGDEMELAGWSQKQVDELLKGKPWIEKVAGTSKGEPDKETEG